MIKETIAKQVKDFFETKSIDKLKETQADLYHSIVTAPFKTDAKFERLFKSDMIHHMAGYGENQSSIHKEQFLIRLPQFVEFINE